jgi:ABC-type nickel/cobalt efflux system permease component RcnA
VVFSLFIARKAAPWEPLAAGFLSAVVHAASGIAVVLAFGFLRGAVAPLADTQKTGAYLEVGTFLALILLTALLGLRKLVGMLRNSGGGDHSLGEAPEGLGLYGIVAVTSLVPCPGAVVMLLFALYLELAWLGVAGVLAMSAGMGIVISAAAYLAYFGRAGLFSQLKGKERAVRVVSDAMELGSYLIVMGFSLFMVWPALAG